MPTLTQPNNLGDGILWEQDSDYSREKVTVISGQNLAVLTVVGKITASGKYTALNPAATDGSEAAAGIMVADCDATAADKEGAIIARDAMIAPDNLVWPAGITGSQKTTALEELAALGIIVRDIA